MKIKGNLMKNIKIAYRVFFFPITTILAGIILILAFILKILGQDTIWRELWRLR